MGALGAVRHVWRRSRVTLNFAATVLRSIDPNDTSALRKKPVAFLVTDNIQSVHHSLGNSRLIMYCLPPSMFGVPNIDGSELPIDGNVSGAMKREMS